MKYVKYIIQISPFGGWGALLLLLLLVGCRSQKEVVDVRLDSVAVREVCVRDSLHTDFCLRFDSLQLYVLDDEGTRVKQVMCVKGGEMSSKKTKTKTKTEADSTKVTTDVHVETETPPPRINTFLILIIAIILLIIIMRWTR